MLKPQGTQVDIPVSQMKDGDIGIITAWNPPKNKIMGNVVQRYGDNLIVLGEPSTKSISISNIPAFDCKVTVFPKGTVFVLD